MVSSNLGFTPYLEIENGGLYDDSDETIATKQRQFGEIDDLPSHFWLINQLSVIQHWESLWQVSK